MKLARLSMTLVLLMPAAVLAQPDGKGPRAEDKRDQQNDEPKRKDPAQHDKDQASNQDQNKDQDRSPKHKRDHTLEHDRPLRPNAISVDELDNAIDALKEINGDFNNPRFEFLLKLAERNPAAATRAINARFPNIKEIIHAREHNPQAFDLHVTQARHFQSLKPLLDRYREARRDGDQAKMQSLRPEIREQFVGLFEVRLEMKRQKLQRMREALEKAEKELADLEQRSEQVVDQEMRKFEKRGHVNGPDGKPQRPNDKRPDNPDKDGEQGEKPRNKDRDKPNDDEGLDL